MLLLSRSKPLNLLGCRLGFDGMQQGCNSFNALQQSCVRNMLAAPACVGSTIVQPVPGGSGYASDRCLERSGVY